MINIVSGGTYYFPKAADYPAAHYTLLLYSDLTKTETEYDLLKNQLVDTDDYIPCYVRDEQYDTMQAGEYNYRLLDVNLQKEVSRGLIRVVKDDDEGDYDPTTDYVVYGIENEWITTNIEDASELWQKGYDSGYTDGFSEGVIAGHESGYTEGYDDGYDDGFDAGLEQGKAEGYENGYNDGYNIGSVEGYNSGLTVGYNSGYTIGYNSGWTDGYNSGFTAGQLTVGGGLELTALEDGCAIAITISGSLNPDLKYRVDNTPFAQWNYRQYEIDIDSGHTVYIKGDNPNGWGNSSSYYVRFVTTGKIKVGGNIAALLDNGTGTQTSIPNRAFIHLFQGTSIVDASDLQLSLVSQYAYSHLFSGCTNLAYAPIILPATTLATQCYNEMFRDCKSLTTVPVLPATTLGNGSYRYMFYGCKALTKAQDILPATTMMNNCYQGMFQSCSNLTDSPILPAETLVNACYSSMFGHCTHLTAITTYAKDISATECLYFWTYDVAAHGDFYNLGGASFPSSSSGIPSGWTKYRLQTY